MIKELELDSNDKIVKYCQELILGVNDIKKEGWHKKFVCSSNDKKYIKSKETNREDEFLTNDKINEIIEDVITIMINNGFTHTKDKETIEKSNIELHYANANSNNEEYIYSWSCIHKDNVNHILVNTFICYFDVECEGGELAFYDEDEEKLLLKIETSILNNKKVIIFEGDIKHNALTFRKGHRYALSCQIPI